MNRFELYEGPDALTTHQNAWDVLALRGGSPFLSCAWLLHWAQSQPGEIRCATLSDHDGALLAGAVFRKTRFGWAAAADAHSGDWDVVAVDHMARRELWENLAQMGTARLDLHKMRLGSTEAAIARDALAEAGYGVLPAVRELGSPYIALPGSYETLLASLSGNARRQLRKRRKDLEVAGQVSFRMTTESTLDRDFDEFLRVEASGWKARQGTAIACDRATESLYRNFSREAARLGWLRLHVLELDGAVVAANLMIAYAGEMFYVKTGFDESQAHLSPGICLFAESLRTATEEGMRGMDLLGRADRYKMTWTTELRPRQRIQAYRGIAGRGAELIWNQVLRPGLVNVRNRARKDPDLRRRLERAQSFLSLKS